MEFPPEFYDTVLSIFIWSLISAASLTTISGIVFHSLVDAYLKKKQRKKKERKKERKEEVDKLEIFFF